MQESRDIAIKLLREKADLLKRIPKKVDMSEQDVMMIKDALGPWPRALEAAGLKEANKIPKSVINKRRRRSTRDRKKLYSERNNEDERQS